MYRHIYSIIGITVVLVEPFSLAQDTRLAWFSPTIYTSLPVAVWDLSFEAS